MARTRVSDPIVTPADSAPAPVTQTTDAPAAPSGEAASERRSDSPAERTFEVVHQHRFGNCKGRLVLSRAGITFHPHDEKSNDAVAVNYGGFQFDADGKTLTIRAPRRTYRFTMPNGMAAAEAELQIAAIGAAIARASGK